MKEYGIYNVQLREKYTGTIYKNFETTVYKEALKMAKLYIPVVEEINDIECYAVILKNGNPLSKIIYYKKANCFKERSLV